MSTRRRIEKLERQFPSRSVEVDGELAALKRELSEHNGCGARRQSLIQEEPIRLCLAIRDHFRATPEDRRNCQEIIDQLVPVWRFYLESERRDASLIYTDTEHCGSYYPYGKGWAWEEKLKPTEKGPG